MSIGLVDVDGHSNYPNYALMKISAYHKQRGDSVEWADPLFGQYDRVYQSKIFTFTPPYMYGFDCEVIKGGTGYDYRTKLPQEIDDMQPDYSIYPQVDNRTAYGFLTRGCTNKCKWCIVPLKEGAVKPYRDIEQITENGKRDRVILMDNNILACDYGLAQIEKIIRLQIHVDFNQALDARLITDDIAKLLAKVSWLNFIRFGCDTPKQVEYCERAMQMINAYRGKPASYLMYTMLIGDIDECYQRLTHFRDHKRVRCVAQPYRDFNNPNQVIPKWQQDMGRWAMRRELYTTCDFKDYQPRKGFTCKQYFE
jgi:hypothetical protein